MKPETSQEYQCSQPKTSANSQFSPSSEDSINFKSHPNQSLVPSLAGNRWVNPKHTPENFHLTVQEIFGEIFLLRNQMRMLVESVEKIQGNLDIILKDYDSFLEHRDFVKQQFAEVKQLTACLPSSNACSADIALLSPFTATQPQPSSSSTRLTSPDLNNPSSRPTRNPSNSRPTEFALSTPSSAIQHQLPSSPNACYPLTNHQPFSSQNSKNWALVAATIPASFQRPSRSIHHQISSSQLEFSGQLPTLSQPLPAIKEAFVKLLNQFEHISLSEKDILSITVSTQGIRPKLQVMFADIQTCNQIWINRLLLHQQNLYPEQVLPPEDRRQRDIVLRYLHSLRQPVDGPHQFNFNAFPQGHSIKIVDSQNNKFFYSVNNKLQPLDFLKSIGLAHDFSK